MIRLFTLLTLLTITYSVNGQGFRKKKIKLPIDFNYSYEQSGNDTVKCKRTIQNELGKIQNVKGLDFQIAMKITTGIIGIESILADKKMGAEGYEKAFEESVDDLKKLLQQNNVELELTEYENEFAFYRRHPVKSKEKLEKEAWEKARKDDEIRKQERIAKLIQERERNQKLDDSLAIVQKKQKKVNDSIDDVNYRIEQQRLQKESFANQKKLEEQKRKEQEQHEEQRIARRQLLVEKYGKENGELMFVKKVKIGWTKTMCLESWGKPKDINRTITSNVTHEQWVYSLKKYLYFDNDILTTIQD